MTIQSLAWRGGLTEENTERIHKATLEVLADVGLRMTDPEAQDLFRKAGAEVDDAAGIVKLPAELVEWGIEQAPRELTRCALNGELYVLRADGMYHCTGTHRTKVLDYGAETSRRATCQDLERLVRVADGLPDIISVSPLITPLDGEDPVELTELEILLTNTGKHIYNAPAAVDEARWTMDAVELMSEAPLLEKSSLTIRACPTTPLVLAEEVAQVIISSARRGAILAIGSASAAGTTAPMTLAGSIVVQNAEFLFGLVLAQLARPGASVDYQVSATVADLRTGMISYGAVEMPLLTAGLKAMAERYLLPFSTNQSSNSPAINVDNGLEKMLHFAYKMAIGINFLRNAGDLDRAGAMSCEQMVIDHEVGRMLQRFWQGIRVDDETLAVDVIGEVGPGSTFLPHPHTLKHCRDGQHYLPPLLYRAQGKPTLLEWAHQEVERVLEAHVYEPAEEKIERLRRYTAKERKRIQVGG
jgi:trimethylamine--corrinoid protein Co-methyltransferase